MSRSLLPDALGNPLQLIELRPGKPSRLLVALVRQDSCALYQLLHSLVLDVAKLIDPHVLGWHFPERWIIHVILFRHHFVIVFHLFLLYLDHQDLVQGRLLLLCGVVAEPAEDMLPWPIAVREAHELQDVLQFIRGVLALESIDAELVLQHVSQPARPLLQIPLNGLEYFKVGHVGRNSFRWTGRGVMKANLLGLELFFHPL